MPKIKLNTITIIVVVTVVASVAMLAKGLMYQPTISAHNRKADEIKEDTKYIEEKNAKIDEDTQRVGTIEYTEEIARENLGMIKKDEIIFIDMDVTEQE